MENKKPYWPYSQGMKKANNDKQNLKNKNKTNNKIWRKTKNTLIYMNNSTDTLENVIQWWQFRRKLDTKKSHGMQPEGKKKRWKFKKWLRYMQYGRRSYKF